MGDVDDLIEEFLSDTRVELDRVQDALARLNQGAPLSEAFDDLYRGVRTIRVAAGRIGLARTAELAASVEASLERLKHGAFATPETLRALARAIDRIARLTSMLGATGAEPPGGDPDLTAALSEDGEARVRQARLDDAMQAQTASAPANVWGTVEAAAATVAAQMRKNFTLAIEPSARNLPAPLLRALAPALARVVRFAGVYSLEPEVLRRARGKRAAGALRITALTVEHDAVIAVSDDGAGIDLERLRKRAATLKLIRAEQQLTDTETAALIFEPGVSSFGEGPGASGLETVRAELALLDATIEVTSLPGRGTTFLIRAPLAAESAPIKTAGAIR